MARSASSAEVLVAGGGLVGLAAALGFASRGRRVLLLERDGAFRDGSADLVFDLWERPGIVNFRQPHTFLGRAGAADLPALRPSSDRDAEDRQDLKGRVRVWSYDGRSKRLRWESAATADAAFRAMYR
jgi:glycine/D-amino acid oxidase-like deaminating enzyme